MGPTTKLPSLGHIGWDAMLASYEEQAAALIEGGVDVLLIETCQDLLQAKIATVAVIEAMRKAGKRLPVQVQVTLQESGTMLLRHRDWRGAHGARALRHRHHRSELRDRSGGDERGGPLSRT